MDFTCNVCGARNIRIASNIGISNIGIDDFGREVPSCGRCLSSVRIRSIMYALSLELFGAPLQLSDFPVLKGLRGAGMTDSDSYARQLAEKFDYKNTFFDSEPKLDITAIEPRDEGTLDFLTSSEVLEHVYPPLEKALENACRLLKPNGILILTVPYAPEGPAMEHYPQLADSGIVHLRSGPVLVNRTEQGELQVFDKLIFHGGSGSTLEMRRLNEAELRRALLGAGFVALHFYAEDYEPFGIRHTESWSLPVAARKQPFVLTENLRADLMRQFGDLRQKISQLCTQLEHSEETVRRQHAKNIELHGSLVERTEWARGLNDELQATNERTQHLESDLVMRTEWARDLERQLDETTSRALTLEGEVESRTKWAQDLERQFQERTEWALQLNHRTQGLERQLAALRAAWWNRLGRLLRILK